MRQHWVFPPFLSSVTLPARIKCIVNNEYCYYIIELLVIMNYFANKGSPFLNVSIYSPNAIVCTKQKLKREKGESGLQNRTEACSERPMACCVAGHALLFQEKSNESEHWSRLLRETVESSSLEASKPLPRLGHHQQLHRNVSKWGSNRTIQTDDLQRSLPILMIL